MLFNHHSLADWDFEHGSLYRSLADDQFVSAPTSLKYTAPGDLWSTTLLCRITGTLALPQGEVRTWVRRAGGSLCAPCFRNQAPLGTSAEFNCYYIVPSYSNVYLYRVIEGTPTNIANTPCYTAFNIWLHYRVFWYNGLTPGEQEALCVDVYYEDAGEWVKQGNTMYDTWNMWKDSEINRCGLLPISQLNYPIWHDDTEIWGPV